MRLVSQDGAFVAIELVGLAPEEPAPHDDEEWLVVRATAQTAEDSWSIEEPSLTTGEAEALASWLGAVSTGGDDEPELDFLEPTLRFEFLSADGDRVLLRAWLTRAVGDEAWVDLSLETAQLAAAAESLSAQLETLPARLAWGEDG